MQPISTSALLVVYEQGIDRSPERRALDLLAAACPDASFDALANLSIGQRDARLMQLRSWTFGTRVASVVSCPGCAERVELEFALTDIQPPLAAQEADPLDLAIEGYDVRLRLLTSLDLMSLAGANAVTARERLLERALLDARRDGASVSVADLPASVIDAIVTALAAADPQAEITLELDCPACARRWEATFDIVSFFWSEIERWARQMLSEVHRLACAYGWNETEILAMSDWRRRCYLELIADGRLSG